MAPALAGLVVSDAGLDLNTPLFSNSSDGVMRSFFAKDDALLVASRAAKMLAPHVNFEIIPEAQSSGHAFHPVLRIQEFVGMVRTSPRNLDEPLVVTYTGPNPVCPQISLEQTWDIEVGTGKITVGL